MRDEDYERALERLRAMLPRERDAVLSRCQAAQRDGVQAECRNEDFSVLHALFAEQERLLKAVEREASGIRWNSGSLFRQALSQEEKRTVCRVLTLLEELEDSLKRLLGTLHRRMQALRSELREADEVSAFLRAVRHVAPKDAEICALCDAAEPCYERLRVQRQTLLARMTESEALLEPTVRRQLPYACGQILRFADLDDSENEGNVRELLALLSSLQKALTEALSRCEERLFLADRRK